MALDAGSVYATLGGKFSAGGFAEFDAAMKHGVSTATAFEKKHADVFSRVGSSALRMGKTVASVAGVTGLATLVTGFAGVIGKAAQFQKQMSSLGAVVDKDVVGSMSRLRAQAIAAGAATRFSALQAAQAQTELATGGLKTSQILGGGLKAALALAAAGELNLADAASITVNAINNFGLKGKDAVHIADALATAANTTSANVGDLGTSLNEAGGVAKQAGQTLDGTVATIEALSKVGQKGANAGGSLKSALLAILTPSKQQTNELKKLHFEVNGLGQGFTDANGKMLPFSDIAGQLQDKLGKLGPAARAAALGIIFGNYGVSTGNALYKAGAKGIDDYIKGLDKQGSAAKTAAEKQDNLAGKVENLKGSIETAAIAGGTLFLPLLERLATKAQDFVNGLVKDGSIQRWGNDLATAAAKGTHALEADWPEIKATATPVLKSIVDVVESIGPAAQAAFGTIAHVIAGAAPFISTVAHGVGDIADALGGSGIAAGAATFLVLSRTLPIIASAAAAIAESGVGGALSEVAMSTPALALLGAGVAAGVFALASNFKTLSDNANDAAAAIKNYQSAADASQNADLAAQQAGLDLQSARAQARAAANARLHAQSTLKTDTSSGESRDSPKRIADEEALATAMDTEAQAALNVQKAELRVKEARDAQTVASKKQQDASEKITQTLNDYGNAADAAALRTLGIGRGSEIAGGKFLNAGQRANAYADYLDHIVASNKNLDASQKTALTSLASVVRQMGHKPEPWQLKIITTDIEKGRTSVQQIQDDLDKAGEAREQPRVDVQGADESTQKIDAVKQAEDNLQDKTITITTILAQMASHEQSEHGQPPPKPKATGGKTSGAELAMIGEDGPEYVVPVGSKYRGRGIALLMAAAKDLGVAFHAKGAGPGSTSGSADPAAIQRAVDAAKTKYEHEKGLRDAAISKLRQAEAESASTKDEKTRRAKDISAAQSALAKAPSQKRLNQLLGALHQDEANLKAIQKYEQDRTNQSTQATTAQANMDLDEKKGDQAKFEKDRTAGLKQLNAEIASTQSALRKAQGQRKIDLQARLAQLQNEALDLKNRVYSPSAAALDLDAILDQDPNDPRRQLSLDQASGDVAGQKRDLAEELADYTAALAKEQAGPNRRDWVIGLADAISGVRSQISGLDTTSADSGPTQDQQAILDQQTARTTAAQAAADANAALIKTLLSSGDLGLAGAPGPNIIIQTLHPGDPATLAAVGDAALAGFGQQYANPAKSLAF